MVQRSRWMVSKMVLPCRSAGKQTHAPAVMAASTVAVRAKQWYMGSTEQKRSCSVASSTLAWASITLTREKWVVSTGLGRSIVPEVKRMVSGSSAVTRFLAARSAASPYALPESSNVFRSF